MQCLKNVFPISNDFFQNNSYPNPLDLTSRGLNLIKRVTKVKISIPFLDIWELRMRCKIHHTYDIYV